MASCGAAAAERERKEGSSRRFRARRKEAAIPLLMQTRYGFVCVLCCVQECVCARANSYERGEGSFLASGNLMAPERKEKTRRRSRMLLCPAPLTPLSPSREKRKKLGAAPAANSCIACVCAPRPPPLPQCGGETRALQVLPKGIPRERARLPCAQLAIEEKARGGRKERAGDGARAPPAAPARERARERAGRAAPPARKTIRRHTRYSGGLGSWMNPGR